MNLSWLLPLIGIGLLIYFYFFIKKQNPTDQHLLILLLTLIITSIVHWSLSFQLFFSINLYIDRIIDKHLFNIPLTTTSYLASASIFIIILGPIFALLWNKLHQYNYQISPLTQFSASLLLSSCGFLVLALSTQYLNPEGLVCGYWIFAAYFILMAADLLLSPIGLSAMTTYSPPHLVGFMMGCWFVATGFGGFFGGILAKTASVPANLSDPFLIVPFYRQSFLFNALLALSTALALGIIKSKLFSKKYYDATTYS